MINVLGIEGMGDFFCLWNQIYLPFAKAYPKLINWQHCKWQNWPTYLNQKWDVVIGHSLGGQSAIDLTNKRPDVGLVITCDPRWQNNLSWFDSFIPFQPNFTTKTKVLHNFYHRGIFLDGYKVDGAAENTIVITDHADIPSAVGVQRLFNNFCKEHGA